MTLIDSVFYFHRTGFVHLNIKPSLVASKEKARDVVWLCDVRFMTTAFDASKEAVTESNKYKIRNPKWTACDPKKDVCAIGSILLELVVRSSEFQKRV